jgi:hypothetical protein
MYGVNAEYAVPITVSGSHYVSAYLRARNTGNDTFYQGAALDLAASTYKRVPPLHWANHEGVCLLNNMQIESDVTPLFETATAGSATLPCELVIGISKTYPVPNPTG